MSLSSLLYVSNSTIPATDGAKGVEQIVATALARNPRLGLTGALLFTGENFAQVLEGDDAALDIIMADITRDPRHEHLLIVDRGELAERRFPDWSLAYFGPSRFVSRHVTRLMCESSPPQRRRAAAWLHDLLWEFSAGPHARP